MSTASRNTHAQTRFFVHIVQLLLFAFFQIPLQLPITFEICSLPPSTACENSCPRRLQARSCRYSRRKSYSLRKFPIPFIIACTQRTMSLKRQELCTSILFACSFFFSFMECSCCRSGLVAIPTHHDALRHSGRVAAERAPKLDGRS